MNVIKDKIVCYCPFCDEPIFEGEDMVQQPIYKMGELNYIELAHRPCKPEWSVNDDWKPDIY